MTTQAITNIVHGRNETYVAGLCRAQCCREAHRVAVAANRADRLANGRITHGKRSGYDAGCHCPECRGARRRASYRESTRAARAAQRPVAAPAIPTYPEGAESA